MIAVRITANEMNTIAGEKVAHGTQKNATPRETERYVLTRLRNAGIPVQGSTFLIALERGELKIRRDFGDYIYEWRAL